jgi:pimeloyl-ACP methyl ester carboxylesterase
VPAANAPFVRNGAVNAPVRLVIISGMNHFIPWERPDLIRKAILTHLKMK